MTIRALSRILLVEDEADIRLVAELALQRVGGFEVQTCGSGEEALELYQTFLPDLVLLDVMLPGIDGPETLKRLKERVDAQSVAVAFMTARVQAHEVSAYKALGALDVVIKPFDPMTLSETILEIWRNHGEQSGPAQP